MNTTLRCPGQSCLGMLLLLAGVSPAQEVNLEWMSADATPKFRYYNPQRLALGPASPAGLKKAPEGISNPLYGEIPFGPAEARQKVLLVIDQPAGGPQRLWVDTNGNGDLNDDPPAVWEARTRTLNGKESTSYSGRAKLSLERKNGRSEVQIQIYRFDPAQRSDAATMLLYYRDWGYAGKAVIGEKTYPAMLDDAAATGDFRGKEGDKSLVNLLLDLNGDGKYDDRSEKFDVRKPFNIGGITYEVDGLTASGEDLRIIKSDKVVEETKPAPTLTASSPPVAFEAVTTSGQTIRFPGDYQGKTVLLDFWATWCGPCLRELPEIRKVYGEFHDKGFEILGVSLDNADSLEKLARFTKQNEMPWPQICDGKGWQAEIAGKYNVHSIPSAFLVNGTTGLITAAGAELRGTGLRDAVEKAVNGKTSAPSTPAAVKAMPEGGTPGGAAPVRVEDPLIAKAQDAQKSGLLLSSAAFLASRESPTSGPLDLARPSTEPLTGRQIARLARDRYLSAGWFYRCTRCDHWHIKLSGAYPIAADAFATAWHLSDPPDTLKEGYFVAVDSGGRFLPIAGVIAGDVRSDSIIMRLKEAALKPLALSTDVEVGDTAYCLSNPLQEKNYFSSGIVNRFLVNRDKGAKPVEGVPPSDLRMNVSTDWAPGSSGAALLDGFGNVIGHVATISPLHEGNSTTPATTGGNKGGRFNNDPLLILHGAIPSRTVLSLLAK